MRTLRTFSLLLVIAAITAACGGASPAASEAVGESQGSEPSQGGQPSQGGAQSEGAAPSQAGGGGGGGGLNGSITYTISGAYTASGELAFFPLGSVFDSANGGWSATFAVDDVGTELIILNTLPGQETITFGDGTANIIGTVAADSENGCTFTQTRNDSGGLAGRMQCTAASLLSESGIGEVTLSAQWDAHP